MSDDAILRQRRVALTQADTGLLLRRMMAEIPGLKVVDKASLSWPDSSPDGLTPHIRFWDGEGEPPDTDVLLWVEQEGWSLDWEYDAEHGHLVIQELPALLCSFDVCSFEESSAVDLSAIAARFREQGRKLESSDLKRAIENAVSATGVPGCFYSMQSTGNEEEKAFHDRIFTIVEEECSDRLVLVEGSAPSILKGYLWAGRGAIAWALEEPTRTLAYVLRPLESLPAEVRAGVTESYGLSITEEQAFHGFIRLGVPMAWPVYAQPSGRQLACDEDSDNGTLWVDCSADYVGAGMAKQLSEQVLERTCASWEEDRAYSEISASNISGYRCVYAEAETVEGGAALRIFSWVFAMPIEEYHVSLAIHLVLTHDNLADPLCEGVVEAVTQGVANIQIDEDAFLEQIATVH